MAKKFALISPLYSFAVEAIMTKMIEEAEGEDIELIQSTPGGNVFSAWALAGFLKDREGNTALKAFGDCSSMGFYNALYLSDVTALDVTQFTIHRADGFVETEDDKLMLANINKELRKAMESNLDILKFEKITGVTLNDIFDPNKRVNVTITAKQAKQIGLVNKVIPMNDKQVNALNNEFTAFSNFFDESQGRDSETRVSETKGEKANTDSKSTNLKKEKMNKQELQAQHPTLYAEIYGEGVKAENKRCSAFLAFKDIDLDACVKGIKESTEMDACFMAEMTAKKLSEKAGDEAKTDSPEAVVVPEKAPEAKTKEQEELSKAEAEVNAILGLKTKEVK